MKSFNLEEYLANPERKVITRCGREVEIMSTNGRERFPIIGYMDDNQAPTYWHRTGLFLPVGPHSYDLFFADEESEDERIRKGLKTIIDNWNYPQELFTTKQKILAYLEKQKEQKPAEWSEEYREEDVQTRFAFYTYKDEPSVLYLSNVFVEEASREHGLGTGILKAAEKTAEAIGATTIYLKVKQDSPANVWYRKNGYGYVTFEDGYDWLEKNLEYMKPTEQEWSDEDELMRKAVIRTLERFEGRGTTEMQINWIKDLHPKHHWKPSEKQMKKLLSIIGALRDFGHIDIADFLASLYGLLKKLKEE